MSPEETFRAQLAPGTADEEIAELRRILTQSKLEALEQIEDLSEAGLRLVIPGLYGQLVDASAQLAVRVGAGVGLALEALDELRQGVSLSTLNRNQREHMTQAAIQLKTDASDAMHRFVAEISAQRLAMRHNHEFLSWLAFRRGDPKYPIDDRAKRFDAFKIHSRLLKSRAALQKLLGGPLGVALEGHDRFMLAHRWPLDPSEEHRLEAAAWLLLSYQPAAVVDLEGARLGVDANPADEVSKAMVQNLFEEQLALAMRDLPVHARRP